jgi:hypothetical protein
MLFVVFAGSTFWQYRVFLAGRDRWVDLQVTKMLEFNQWSWAEAPLLMTLELETNTTNDMRSDI